MSSGGFEPQTFELQRGFRWIGPFFAGLIPFAVWAFFFDPAEPPDVQGGILAVAAFTVSAVFGHLTAVRTAVVLTDHSIEVRGMTGTRSARWSEIAHASIDRGDVVLHLASGKPLRASGYLDGMDRLVSLFEARGLFRRDPMA